MPSLNKYLYEPIANGSQMFRKKQDYFQQRFDRHQQLSRKTRDKRLKRISRKARLAITRLR